MESDTTSVEDPLARQQRWLRLAIGLCVVLVIALLTAGFVIISQLGGSSDKSPGVANGSTPTATPTTKAQQLVACMRKNGVPKFPDPGSDGQIRIIKMDGVDMDSPEFKQAEQACQALMPKGPAPKPASPPPTVDTKDYVACMRRSGVPDLPDPVDGTFAYDTGSAKFKTAHATCKKFLPKDAPAPN